MFCIYNRKRLEQDRDEERKMTKSQISLLEYRLVQIKEKDGEIKRMEERIEDLATRLYFILPLKRQM